MKITTDQINRILKAVEDAGEVTEPSELDLVEFVNGTADEQQKRIVEAYLLEHPGCIDSVQKDMEEWRGENGERKLNDFRRRVFASLPGWPSPPGPNPSLLEAIAALAKMLYAWLNPQRKHAGDLALEHESRDGLFRFRVTELKNGDWMFAVETNDPASVGVARTLVFNGPDGEAVATFRLRCEDGGAVAAGAARIPADKKGLLLAALQNPPTWDVASE